MVKLRKYEVILTAFLLIAVNLHRIFDGTGIKADIFIFYDYEGGRNVSNILYEIGMHLSRIIPAVILALRFNHLLFRIILIYFILEFAGYLLFFGQGVTLYIVSILLTYYIISVWKKRKKRVGIYFWQPFR